MLDKSGNEWFIFLTYNMGKYIELVNDNMQRGHFNIFHPKFEMKNCGSLEYKILAKRSLYIFSFECTTQLSSTFNLQFLFFPPFFHLPTLYMIYMPTPYLILFCNLFLTYSNSSCCMLLKIII